MRSLGIIFMLLIFVVVTMLVNTMFFTSPEKNVLFLSSFLFLGAMLVLILRDTLW